MHCHQVWLFSRDKRDMYIIKERIAKAYLTLVETFNPYSFSPTTSRCISLFCKRLQRRPLDNKESQDVVRSVKGERFALGKEENVSRLASNLFALRTPHNHFTLQDNLHFVDFIDKVLQGFSLGLFKKPGRKRVLEVGLVVREDISQVNVVAEPQGNVELGLSLGIMLEGHCGG